MSTMSKRNTGTNCCQKHCARKLRLWFGTFQCVLQCVFGKKNCSLGQSYGNVFSAHPLKNTEITTRTELKESKIYISSLLSDKARLRIQKPEIIHGSQAQIEESVSERLHKR